MGQSLVGGGSLVVAPGRLYNTPTFGPGTGVVDQLEPGLVGAKRGTGVGVAVKKKASKKAPAKPAAKSAAKSAAKKAPAAKKSVPKKAAKKASKAVSAKKSAPAKKSAAKKTSATKKSAAKKTSATKANSSAAKSSAKKATTKKNAAAKKPAASAANSKSAGKPAARKATAKNAVATSKTDSKSKNEAPVIPPDAEYLRDKAWLKAQKEALVQERASYTSSANRLAAEAAALMADREPGDVQFDEESGEGDTIAVERDRDLALSAAARQSVEEIDAALARLEAGHYGICVVSGLPIPRERLEAIPEASMRVEHKTSMF